MLLERKILVPFNPKEAISTKEAAARAGKSQGCIRFWIMKYAIGRKIGHDYHVSLPALEMVLNGDWGSLDLLHCGERNCESVAPYFRMFGL